MSEEQENPEFFKRDAVSPRCGDCRFFQKQDGDSYGYCSGDNMQGYRGIHGDGEIDEDDGCDRFIPKGTCNKVEEKENV